MNATTPRATARVCLRCVDCLSIWFVEVGLRPDWRGRLDYNHQDYDALRAAPCPHCDGRVESMGEVKRGRLVVRDTMASPCNELCATARGPVCCCSCGGRHHGTGLVLAFHDRGFVPAAGVDPKAIERAATYRALYETAHALLTARYGADLALRNGGGWLEPDDWYRWTTASDAMQALSKATAMRSHAGRNKRLQAIVDGLRGAST